MKMVHVGRRLLMVGVAASVLTACGGADDIASPGEGVIIGGGGNGGGTTTPPPRQHRPCGELPHRNRRPRRQPGGQPPQLRPPGADRARRCRCPRSPACSTRSMAASMSAPTSAVTAPRPAASRPPCRSIRAWSSIGQSQASFLVVNRGSQINAVGSGTAPIIFTSLDNLEGRVDRHQPNQWGGIQLLGRAPISNCLSAVAGGSRPVPAAGRRHRFAGALRRQPAQRQQRSAALRPDPLHGLQRLARMPSFRA